MEYERWINPSGTWLLKLHGSINWFAKLGAPQPHGIDDIVHLEEWYRPPRKKQTGDAPDESEVRRHVEGLPFIVPPLLNKSALTQEPLLRNLWTQAYTTLQAARQVIFVGYSLPPTDLAARSLFSEAIPSGVPIVVVDWCEATDPHRAKGDLIRSYEDLFGQDRATFRWDGSLAWSRDFIGG